MQWLFKLIAPLIRELVLGIVDQQAEVYKWKKALDYVELPNEADKGVLKLQDQVNVLKDTVKGMVKDVHPPVIDRKEVEQLKDNVNNLMKMFNKAKKIRSL